MNAYELKRKVNKTGSRHFKRDSMRFFGDTMANYYVPVKPVELENEHGRPVLCWELKRRYAVKQGLQSSAFFDCDNFERIYN